MLYNPFNKRPVKRVTTGTTYTLTTGDSVVIFETGGAVAITLPLAESEPGRVYTIISVDSTVTLTRSGSDTIIGSNTHQVQAGASTTYMSDGVDRYEVIEAFLP